MRSYPHLPPAHPTHTHTLYLTAGPTRGTCPAHPSASPLATSSRPLTPPHQPQTCRFTAPSRGLAPSSRPTALAPPPTPPHSPNYAELTKLRRQSQGLDGEPACRHLSFTGFQGGGGGSLTEAPTHTPRLTCLHARRGGAAATDPPHGRGRADPSNRRPRGPYPPTHTHTHSAGKNRRLRSPPHPPRAVPTCDGARDKAGGCEGAAGGTALPSRFAAATSTVARVRRGRVSRA